MFRNLRGGGYGDDGGNACHPDLPEVCNKSKRDISQSSLRQMTRKNMFSTLCQT